MPIMQDMESDEVVSLEETMDYFATIDVSDHDCLLAGAPKLRALANNRTFLARMIADELKDPDILQKANEYSAQVFFLGRSQDFFMRANFWPAATDPIVRTSGGRHFFYDRPHDHNFDFLTVGYYGPGYLSDFYEYDHAGVVGYLGEPLDLRYMGRDALPFGRIMLYRASVDVHNQIPPESFSISLNVMPDLPGQIANVMQYMIDMPSNTIESIANKTSLPLLCNIAGHIGDAECADVISHISAHHPDPRGRIAAYAALAKLDSGGAEHVWTRAASDSAAHVWVQARIHLERLEERV
jgi:hypothetical protein